MIRTLQEGEDGYDSGRRDVDNELVFPEGELLDVLGEAGHEPGAVAVEIVSLGLVFISRVDDGSLKDLWVVPGRVTQIRDVLGDGDAVAAGAGDTAHHLKVAAALHRRSGGPQSCSKGPASR